MKHKTIMAIFAIIASIVLITDYSLAQFLYYSQREVDRHGNPRLFTPGSYSGSIHSDSLITFGHLPFRQSLGTLSTSLDRFGFANGVEMDDLELSDDPIFNIRVGDAIDVNDLAPITNNIRRNAYYISSDNGRYISKIVMDRGVTIYQYRAGSPPSRENVVFNTGPMSWGGIFVDGEVEISGVVMGNMSIGASGNIFITDDLRYDGADRITGDFDDEGWNMEHSLLLSSEKNVYIKNTFSNGRDNGWNVDVNNHYRHSVVINALIIAPFGGFYIQHTNAEWEAYQGPSPDLRGICYLKGAVYTRDGMELFYSHNGGTGYRVDFRNDSRAMTFAFAQFRTYNFWVVRDTDIAYYTLVGNIIFPSANTLNITHRFVAPFDIRNEVKWTGEPRGRAEVNVGTANDIAGTVAIRTVDFREGVYFNVHSIDTEILSSTFENEVHLKGENIVIRDSHFKAPLVLDAWNSITIERCILSGLEISGNPRNVHITNVTSVNAEGDGIHLESFRNATIKNSIIYGSGEAGIRNTHYLEPSLIYNCLYKNDYDYVGCSPRRGSISADPLFVDYENADYNLREDSPCIDAGDPDSPLDPDGTRADIGAHYFDQRQLSSSEEDFIPGSFELESISPNPFNAKSVIKFQIPEQGIVKMKLYDITGRLVGSISESELHAGVHTVGFDGSALSSGLYFVKLNFAGETKVQRAVIIK